MAPLPDGDGSLLGPTPAPSFDDEAGLGSDATSCLAALLIAFLLGVIVGAALA